MLTQNNFSAKTSNRSILIKDFSEHKSTNPNLHYYIQPYSYDKNNHYFCCVPFNSMLQTANKLSLANYTSNKALLIFMLICHHHLLIPSVSRLLNLLTLLFSSHST
ncbi:hypothetical protein V8G54_032011 [Vigna mungo]|uniref:Uncharacterized protein n=1 Tax=Vigna mungo TaxID=3915 RepID=A0AAQ3RHG6_VIGMU